MRGVRFMFSELSIKFLAVATVLTVCAGAYFSITVLEWCAVVLALALVWAAEGLNTALERLTDLVSPGFHPSLPSGCSFSSRTSSNIPAFQRRQRE